MSASLRSVAITPDGNRRYASRYRVSPSAAYAQGFQKVREVSDWALDSGVKTLTVWGMSHDNFAKRSPQELTLLFSLMRGRITEALESTDFDNKGVRVRFVGRLDVLPEPLRNQMRQLEERTQDNPSLTLNVAVAYSGQEELVRAARELAGEVSRGVLAPDEINSARFSQHLYLSEPVDLMIRTGGMKRMSGFLPWQSEYAEFYFTDKLWPEFTQSDFQAAVDYYHSIPRNFGR